MRALLSPTGSLCAGLVLAAAMAAAQVAPAGPEFQVNTWTTGWQAFPDVAALGPATFVVVWQSGDDFSPQDGDGYGVFMQRLTGRGMRLGGELQVNVYTPDYQVLAAVAADVAGSFVVVWQSGGYRSGGPDGDGYAVSGRGFDATGTPSGGEFQVNAYTTFHQSYPSVAAGAAGDFIVVWQSGSFIEGPDGDSYGVFGRQIDGVGAPLGGEFQVNTYTYATQYHPEVAANALGEFVVAWSSLQDGDDYGNFGQRFDAAAGRVGLEFQLNTFTPGEQFLPVPALRDSGDFTVVWGSNFLDGDLPGVFARLYDASGVAAGPELQVNRYTTSYQWLARLAHDASGGFVVVWSSALQDGDGFGIIGRHFDSAGAALGAEFQINVYATGDQLYPAIASDSAGRFMVVWMSFDQDGDQAGVFGRALEPALPVALLRNTEITALSPVSPPLATILPLDPAAPPAGDRYLEPVAPGDVDPEASVLGDAERPLVLYGLDTFDVLRLVKIGGQIRIEY